MDPRYYVFFHLNKISRTHSDICFSKSCFKFENFLKLKMSWFFRFNYSDFDLDFENAKELRWLEDKQIEQLEWMRGDIMTSISPPKTQTRIPIHRDWERAHDHLWNLYFSANCRYPESKFRR
ncbi:hypothetical protein Droror1_Dr00017879 [Drosera rotundifolia]